MAPPYIGKQFLLLSGIVALIGGTAIGSTTVSFFCAVIFCSVIAFLFPFAKKSFRLALLVTVSAFALGVALSSIALSRLTLKEKVFSELPSPIHAQVISFPNQDSSSTFIVQDTSHAIRIRVTALRPPTPVRGDIITVSGKLTTLTELPSSYATYLHAHNVVGAVTTSSINITSHHPYAFWTTLTLIREYIASRIARILPQNEGSFITALILGNTSLPRALVDDFRISGLQHIIAVSGTHVTLLAISLGVLARLITLPRGFAHGIVLILISGYVLLVGSPASAVRAGVMGVTGIFALILRRQAHAMRLLLYAIVGISIISPLALWGDVGFQLSVMAMFGMLSLAPRIQKMLPLWLPKKMSELVAVTIGAQIATLPVLISTFERVSLYGLPANILTVPLTPLLFLFAGISCVGLLLPSLFRILLSLPARFVSHYIITVAHHAATLPYASVRLDARAPLVILLYSVVLFPVAKDILEAFTEIPEDDMLKTI